MTDPDTKIIQTVLLLLVAGIVVSTHRELFFGRQVPRIDVDHPAVAA